jgi:hypothetical protein
MLTLLSLRMSAAFACRGFLTLASLSPCPRSICAAVCSVLACYVLLVGASVADATVPAGERMFAAGLVHSCLSPLSLPPSSRGAKRVTPPFRPFGGAEAEAPLG